MFQALRNSNQIYVLHKEASPYVEVGSVVNVTPPAPKFPNGVFGQPQEMTVDITVKVGEQNITFQKLPAGADIADFGMNGNVVISCSKDAMNAEIASMKQKSSDILKSIDYHKSVVTSCDEMLKLVNPDFAKEKEQEEKIAGLENKIQKIESGQDKMMEMLAEFLKEKKPSTNNKKTE